MFCKIAISKSSVFNDILYTYSIPAELEKEAKIGVQVIVEFGKRKCFGYIARIMNESDIPPEKTKSIQEIRNTRPLFNQISIELARWISDHYVSLFGRTLKLFLPPGISNYERLKGKKRFADIDDQVQIARQMTKGQVSLLKGFSREEKVKKYLRMSREVIERGQSVIVLLPEITRDNIVLNSFEKEFGDIVSVIHSEVAEKERQSSWFSASGKNNKIMIGTRNALFMPLNNIGLIIIDQEEGYAYKQEQSPKYHARDVALKMNKMTGIPVLLESSSPTLETYHRCRTGEFRLIEASKEETVSIPEIILADMSKEREEGFGVLGAEVLEALNIIKENKTKAAVLLNRRGYSPFLFCNECGHVIQCPDCRSTLTYHTGKTLKCHKCDFSRGADIICPNCKSSFIRFSGTGVQRVESELKKYFPDTRIIRIDRDSVKDEKTFMELISEFQNSENTILLGTQLALKALERTQASLVCVISADTALNNPDFRAGEYAFQFLFSTMGLSGNCRRPDKVVIQTMNPHHYAIKFAAEGNYNSFYEHEIAARELGQYPPFTSLIMFSVKGEDKDKTKVFIKSLSKEIKESYKDIHILGPVASEEVKGVTEMRMLIKGKDLDIIKPKLRAVVFGKQKDLKIGIDVDPISSI